MNKKFFFSCLICIFTLALSITFYFNDQTIIESENRNVTTFPKVPQKISSSAIRFFFTQLTQFYNDNFPNREKIILTLTKHIPSIKTENFSTDTVIIGKNDWLFLGNSYSNIIDKLEGKIYYHDSYFGKYDISTRYNYYYEIMNKLSAHHNKIIFLIAPEKCFIYPEFLPKTIIPAEKSFHEQLTQKMKQENFPVYYPRQDLLQAKEKAVLYYLTDTHWNHYGAFIAFIHLIPQVDPTLCNIIKEEDFSLKPIKSHAGDLIGMGNFIFKDKGYQDNFQPYYKNSPIAQPEHIFKSRTLNPPIKEYTNSNALLDKTLLVVGDSFTIALSPYFSLTFKNWYFIHKDDLEKISTEQLTAIHADYVIYEVVERSF